MLNKKMLSRFEKRIYGNLRKQNMLRIDIDYADYNTLNAKHSGMDIAMSGWMSPHEDHEWAADECWTFKVLALCDDEKQVLVHTMSNGKIAGCTMRIGRWYSFLYLKTHALLPESIAHDVVEAQSWDVETLKEWISMRSAEGYTEKAQMAWCFIHSESSDIEKEG